MSLEPQTATVGVPGPSPAAPPAPASSRAGEVTDFLLRYAVAFFLVALLIAATFIYDGFWDTANLRNVLSQNAPVGLVAIGMTYVIIAGGFDLSVGSLFAAGAVLFASFSNHMAVLPALLLVLLIGGACGTVNGVIVTKMNVNSFIATIGTGAGFTGLTLLYCDSLPITSTNTGFKTLGLGMFHGFPWVVILLVVVFAVAAFVLAKSVYGRRLYVVGGNIEAARLAGLRVDALRLSTFVLIGVGAVLAGAILASQLGVGQPTIGGTVALDTFTIVVIGGTSVYGGQGAIWRTAVGLLVIAVMTNLFNSEALDAAWQSIAKGAVLLAALGLDALSRRRLG